MDWLKRYASGLQKTAAPSLRNQAGILSNPVAVGLRVSSALNIDHSDNYVILAD